MVFRVNSIYKLTKEVQGKLKQTMKTRSHDPKKESKIHFAQAKDQFQSRPFTVQEKPQAQETPDLQAQLEKAKRFGHNFANISIQNPDSPTPPRIQPKLTIGAPGDKYEQEADKTAAEVVQRLHAPVPSYGRDLSQPESGFVQQMKASTVQNSNSIHQQGIPNRENRLMRTLDVSAPQREVMLEEDKELQMKPTLQRQSGEDGMFASLNLEATIQQARGSGQPLAQSIREPMEQAFGADFSGVKIHTDAQSHLMNQSIQAKAFTTGKNIFFRQGAYEPGSRGGQELLAHELTHVVQQNGDAVQRKVAYENPSTTFIHQVKEVLKTKLVEKRKIFKEEDQSVLDTILTTEFYGGKLFEALSRLSYDEQDYGTFDLNNEQHLMLLFYEIKKHLTVSLAKVNPTEESEKENQAAKNKTKEQEEYFAKSPNPGLTFETAFLGAGAATAYYLTTMGGSVDPYTTIVIGPTQPWAEERGPGVINHPMHMIDALRQEVGLSDESLAPREKFSEIVEEVIDKYVIHRRFNKIEKVTKITNQKETYYQIEADNGVTYYAKKVVASLGIGPHITPQGQTPLKKNEEEHAMNMDKFQNHAPIIKSKVERPQDITVVISGGNAAIDSVMTSIQNGFTIIWVTGSQRPALLPGTDNETVEEEYDKVMRKEASKISRVIKTYAQIAEENPNAAEGKPIIVKTSEGEEIPADYFVYAMGPDISKVKAVFDKETVLNKLVPTYDKNRQFGDDGLSAVVGLEVENQSKNDKTSLEIIGGSAFRMAGGVKYDYMLRQMHLFVQVFDHMTKLQGIFTSLGESLVDNNVYSQVITGMGEASQAAQEYQSKAIGDLNNIQSAKQSSNMPDIAAAPNFSSIVSKITSLKVSKNLEEVCQKYLSNIRFVENYAKMLAGYAASVHEYFKKQEEAKQKGERLRDPDPRTAAAQMGRVIETLPLNIAVNDQLTPTRSQIEATQAFVPRYASEDVNFATDSGTVLSIYISVNFPNLSNQQVDEWVDRIIRWRRPSENDREEYTMLYGPIPNPKGKNREDAHSFGEWFKKRLAEENAKAAEKQK
ncbi:MAG: DUF4157 domain-containing protein [Cyanobacteriota bacterium]